jgi:hypothetical protein
MKILLPAFLFITLLGSCKKAIENKQEQIVMNAITTGSWKVSNYLKGSESSTAKFDNYSFKFHPNYTVDALRNSVLEASGYWEENRDAGTITAGFNNSGEPLSLLNGVWHILETTWTSVEANQVVNGETRLLKLEKLP